jgi:hypothetical protein
MRAIVLHTRYGCRSQFWSQLSPFIGVCDRSAGRFASVNGDVLVGLDVGLRIWKACWVQALAGSNPASSATPTSATADHKRTVYEAVPSAPSWTVCVSMLVEVRRGDRHLAVGRGSNEGHIGVQFFSDVEPVASWF